jgi:hypothetical protein
MHYTAFRIVLVVIVLLVLGGAGLVIADPPVWAAVLDFLGLG